MLGTSTTSSGSSKKSTVVRSDTQLAMARFGVGAAFAVNEALGAAALLRLFTAPRTFARPPREAPIIERGERFVVAAPRHAPRWAGAPTDVVAWRWGHGPTVLLVHGWEGRGSQLGAFVAPLCAMGLSVVAFDAPGHGDSPGNRLLLPDFADVIAAVAHAVGPIHATVAHSFGGAATLLARQRGAVDLGRLVLIAPNVLLPASLASFAQLLELDADARAAFTRELAAQSGMSPEQLELPRLIGHADAPLLVVHDVDDREITPAGSEALVAAWPGATLRRTVGLGHRRILRDADVTAEVAHFVAAGAAPHPDELGRALGADWVQGFDADDDAAGRWQP